MPHLQSLPDDAGPPAIFARYPQVYEPWAHMSQALMNGPSPLDPGLRELILAYAAAVSGCSFVAVAHAEVACAWGIDRGLVERLMANPDLEHDQASAGLDARLAALLAFVRRLAGTPNAVRQADVDAVLAAGWDEHALHDAVAITARAAFMQRLVAGFGFAPLSREVAARHAAKRVERGYVNLYAAFRQPASPQTE